jgi:L-arabinokinase
MTLAYYISGHGLGHVSRSIELIEQLCTRRGDVHIVALTSAPAWAFARLRSTAVRVEPLETDPGVVQIDSLNLDEHETARRASRFYGDGDRRIEHEARRLRQLDVALVVGDISPLAFAAASRTGVRSVAVANFTWDWIYAYYPEFAREAPGVIESIGRWYSDATLALRLPFPGGFETMTAVTDIPFIARRSTRARADTRRALGVDGGRPLVLSSFAGHGATLPYARLAASGLAVLSPEQVPPAGLKYEDLVAAADVVVSKPGYGIVSECVANRTPLLYTSRGPFAEYDVMVAEMPRLLRCRYFDQEDLLAGNWTKAIDALLSQPDPPEWPRTDGAAIAADRILSLTG